MSLVDIDKSSPRRTSPTPNSSDGLAQRMAHQTVSTSYATNESPDERIQMLNNRILFYGPGGVLVQNFGQQGSSGSYGIVQTDANGIPRIYIGQAPSDGRLGIWVSVPGVDVTTII